MSNLRFALRNLWRDLKSGELSVLLLAMSVAVLSLTAVGFFTSRISQGVRAQAAEVLAGCFPGRTVIPIDCLELVWGLGTLHCISQQQPA